MANAKSSEHDALDVSYHARRESRFQDLSPGAVVIDAVQMSGIDVQVVNDVAEAFHENESLILSRLT